MLLYTHLHLLYIHSGGMEGGRVKGLKGGGAVGRVLPGQLELGPGCHACCGWLRGAPEGFQDSSGIVIEIRHRPRVVAYL